MTVLHARVCCGQVLADFHAGVSRILITTNVLSRGIDVPAVTLVIQYDMPVMKGGVCDPETYLHRVGRTGRFGRKGVALNLIHDEKEMKVCPRSAGRALLARRAPRACDARLACHTGAAHRERTPRSAFCMPGLCGHAGVLSQHAASAAPLADLDAVGVASCGALPPHRC